MEGRVEIQKETKLLNILSLKTWNTLQKNQKLVVGDVIRTGNDSSLEFTLNDNVFIRVDENTQIKINNNEVIDKKRNSSIFMKTGRVWARVKSIYKEITNFEVNTPTAVAGVRGTLFSVYTDGKDTTVSVKEGAVAVSGHKVKKDELVTRQRMSTVSNNKVGNSKILTNDEEERWNNSKVIEWIERAQGKNSGHIINSENEDMDNSEDKDDAGKSVSPGNSEKKNSNNKGNGKNNGNSDEAENNTSGKKADNEEEDSGKPDGVGENGGMDKPGDDKGWPFEDEIETDENEEQGKPNIEEIVDVSGKFADDEWESWPTESEDDKEEEGSGKPDEFGEDDDPGKYGDDSGQEEQDEDAEKMNLISLEILKVYPGQINQKINRTNIDDIKIEKRMV
ncbi:MAG: FecR domain-containing protein [Bacillota bacterium]